MPVEHVKKLLIVFITIIILFVIIIYFCCYYYLFLLLLLLLEQLLRDIERAMAMSLQDEELRDIVSDETLADGGETGVCC